jgi:hypothetical protein
MHGGWFRSELAGGPESWESGREIGAKSAWEVWFVKASPIVRAPSL